MPVIEIDVGPLPPTAKSVLLDYRDADDAKAAFLSLGETSSPVSRWSAPTSPIVVRARIRDIHGRVWPGREARFTTAKEVDDRPPTADLTAPAVTVKQDGPVLEIEQEVPEGSAPEEFVVEAIQTPSPAPASPKDGLHLGYHRPCCPIVAHAWPDDQAIWTRLVRKADGQRTAWASANVTTAKPSINPTDGFTNAFASGTIALVGGASGQAPLEVSGGDLRHKALYIGDADGYIGDADYFIGDASVYWSPATFTTPVVELGRNEDLQFQFQPKLTSITRPTFYIGDALSYIGGPPRIDVDGTAFDNRLRRLNLTGGADEVPLDIDVKVATSETTAPSFGDADFVPLVPGKVYRNVTAYACRVVIRTGRGVRVTFDELRFWHWIWCRSRPWHSHSDAYEILYDFTAGGNLASLTANVALATYHDVKIEVQWKNADASASQLFLRFNNDSGSNYYKDGAAAATSLLVGGGTLASGWWEHAVVRIVNGGASGAERACRVESAARWSATDSEAPGDESSVMWDNTADAISSVVFDATVGATPLGTGSRFRIWGKRHHAS